MECEIELLLIVVYSGLNGDMYFILFSLWGDKQVHLNFMVSNSAKL